MRCWLRAVSWPATIVMLAYACLALPSAIAQSPGVATDGTPSSGLRRLAPGVVIQVSPRIEEEETYSGPRPMVELMQQAAHLQWQPRTLAESETLLAKAKGVFFRRQIWGLEFGFKPLRMISVDAPQSDGTTVPQQVHYLVYYVKNNGRQMNPAPQPDAQGNVLYSPEPVDHTIRFFPGFILQAHDLGQAYLDRVIPAAIEQIRRREDPGRTFYNSVTISSVTIPVSTEYEDHSVWGIATWTGIDARSDFMSIFVEGLTNAYRWQDPDGAYPAGAAPMTGRRFTFKTLQLNFWRAGDAIDPREDEIRFGVPNQNQVPSGKDLDDILRLYRLRERVDYLWVYTERTD